MKTALMTANIVQGCQQYCLALLSLISLQSGVTMLINILTTLNSVGNKTLFNSVFIRPEQVVRFCCAYKT